jgi:hypothetical protein
MITISNKLVPAAELRRVTSGSFEQKIETSSEIITTHLRDQVFGEDAQIEVVATYADHAVVHAKGLFHKVDLRESESGAIHVVGVSPLEVETIDESDVSKFAAREAESVVDLFFKGSVEAARGKLRGILPIVLTDRQRDESQAVEAVESLLTAPRSWRTLFQERSAQFKRFILDELETLEEHRLQSKFQVLYEGSIDGPELSGYADLVAEDLGIVLDRIAAIQESTESAYRAAAPALDAASEEGDATFPMYKGFAEDLNNDLQQLHDRASKAALEIEDVACRGKLRDMLAEAVHPYEVASRFVVAVATRLTAEVH